MVRTPPFHGGNTGSIPVGDAKQWKRPFPVRERPFLFPPTAGKSGARPDGRALQVSCPPATRMLQEIPETAGRGGPSQAAALASCPSESKATPLAKSGPMNRTITRIRPWAEGSPAKTSASPKNLKKKTEKPRSRTPATRGQRRATRAVRKKGTASRHWMRVSTSFPPLPRRLNSYNDQR